MSESTTKPAAGSAFVSGAIVRDTIVEMLVQPDSANTEFVGWQDGAQVDVGGVRDLDGTVLKPYGARNNLLLHRVVLFPSAVGEYDDEGVLLGTVRTFVHKYADLTPEFEEIACYYILLSWVYDAFREVPYLRLKGEFGSGKSRCLLTLGAICYKPMFASGASTVSPLFRIIDAFRGTLVLDESDFRLSDERAEIIKILNNGNAIGFPVLRSEVTPGKEFNPRAFAVFGPKIIASRRLFEDRALESRCITEVLRGAPPRPEVPLSLPEEFFREAESIRNQLLRYRFNRWKGLSSADHAAISDPRIEGRIAQVYGPLLAVASDPAARERILVRATNASAMLQAERGASIEAQLLGSIGEVLREGAVLSMKNIAQRFANEYGADFRRPITARWMGNQLRSRLSVAAIKSHGVFVIPIGELPMLRDLAARHDVQWATRTEET